MPKLTLVVERTAQKVYDFDCPIIRVGREMGLEVVAAEEKEGRIEAVATTRWFGFKDDVVVRVSPAAGGSRIDVRSKSRVGRSDVGANARRIERFLMLLTTQR